VPHGPDGSARRRGVRDHYGPMPLSRIAWVTTVAVCMVTAMLLLMAQYYGYAGVFAAVGLSAAINLR